MLNSEQQTKLLQFIAEMNDRGKNIPAKISDIPDIPYQDFQSILDAFRVEKAQLLRFRYEMIPAILAMIGSGAKRLQSNVGLAIMYGGPIAAIVGAYLVSWWFLLLIPLCIFLGGSISKKAYNDAIFQAAFDDEQTFCFLFFLGQISLSIDGVDKQIYFKRDDT